MNRTKLALLALLIAFTLVGTGCGRRRAGVAVTTTTVGGTYGTFNLTLQNNRNQTLLPGPIVAEPYDPNIPAVQIPPGGSATYSIGFLPTSITVGATGVGSFSTYVYPTETLFLGVDYFGDATGVTFIYR